MAKGQKGQLVTKKHLARQERENRQNRIILIVSIVVIVLVIGLIGYGIVQTYILEPSQPVAKVADNNITTKDFQTFARYQRVQLIQQYQQYEQFAQLFGSDQASLGYIQQYLAQINYQLEPTNLGQGTLDYLIADKIVQKEAEKLGISVSDDEINKALQDYFGYFPNGTPTSAPTSISVPTSTLNPTQIRVDSTHINICSNRCKHSNASYYDHSRISQSNPNCSNHANLARPNKYTPPHPNPVHRIGI